MNKSEAARQAMDFLRQIHRDVGDLVQAVDADADGRGWASIQKNRISTDLSNGLAPEAWVIRYVTRVYVPRQVSETSSVAVAFMVAFQPEHHQEAIACSIGARLSPAVSRDGLWQGWKDARPLLKHLAANRRGGDVPADVLKAGFSPSAVAGVAFLSPLLELEDMDIVRKRLLDSVFAAVA
jgi:hypothetical protein